MLKQKAVAGYGATADLKTALRIQYISREIFVYRVVTYFKVFIIPNLIPYVNNLSSTANSLVFVEKSWLLN